jgi:MFS family permease
MTSPANSPKDPGTGTPESSLRIWLRLSPVMVCCGLMMVAYSYTMPAFALVLEYRGIPAWMIGINSGSQNFVIFAMGIFVPRFLRTVGLWRGMTLGLFSALLAAAAMMAVEPPWGWVPFRMLIGAGFYIAFIGGEVWLSQEAGDRLRGRIIGAYGSACATGLFVGPLLVQWTGTAGLTPFLVTCAILGAAFLPLIVLRGSSPAMDAPSGTPLLGYLRLVPVVMAVILLYGVVDQSLLSLLPIYGLHAGLDHSRALLLLTVWIAGAVTLQIPMGWLSDRFGRRRITIACGASALIACALLPFLIHGGVWLWIVLVLCGAGVMGMWTISLATLGDCFRGTDLAAATTMYGICYAIGASFGPSIAGTGMDLWDPHGLMVVLGVVSGAFVLFALGYSIRHGWRERST